MQGSEDLNVGDEVRVRGKLADDLVFEASNVVIGELLNVVGTATTDPVINGSTYTFTFTPSAGQALVGPYTVTGSSVYAGPFWLRHDHETRRHQSGDDCADFR